MEKLTAGLWRWTARHPEWHPGEFGAEVVSFAADAGDDTLLLIDPLLPSEPDEVLEQLDTIAAGAECVAILISIPYHVRSAEELRKRYKATIHGHEAAAKRLSSKAGFHEIETGTELPGGVTAYPIGKPRRHETPLHLPSHKALVFGDAVAEYDGALRVWADGKIDDKAKRFYKERFNPTLEPLLDLDFDTVLVTHGAPVMTHGKEALRRALEAEPWSRHG